MGALPNLDWWEKTRIHGSQPGLESIQVLLDLLGSPQNVFKSIHVTGTNGKGSTSAMIASILRESGYHVGLFTSPHLSRFTENIVIDGVEITESQMDDVLGRVKDKIVELESLDRRHPTHFEVQVAACFQYFMENEVDIAVIEVGMGGRDDATNVIPSSVSVLTNVSLEHSSWLGDTVEEIAEVKAGILRHGTALVTAASQEEVLQILERITQKQGSSLIRVGVEYLPFSSTMNLTSQTFHLSTPHSLLLDLETPLLGNHQIFNASCAVAAVQFLNDPKITNESIHRGLSKVVWRGRFEIMKTKPFVLLDGAKDVKAIESLTETVNHLIPHMNLITVISTSSDKNYISMVDQLADITTHFIVTEHRVTSRTATVEEIEEAVKRTGVPYEVMTPVQSAIKGAIARAGKLDAVLITGSVFLVGEAREYWHPQLSSSG